MDSAISDYSGNALVSFEVEIGLASETDLFVLFAESTVEIVLGIIQTIVDGSGDALSVDHDESGLADIALGF